MAIQSIFIISDSYSVLPEFCAGAKLLGDSVTAVVFGDDAGGIVLAAESL